MIKNYSGVLVNVDKVGKETVIARTENKDLAKIAAKNLNIAEKIKSTVKPLENKEDISNTFFIDKHKSKYV